MQVSSSTNSCRGRCIFPYAPWSADRSGHQCQMDSPHIPSRRASRPSPRRRPDHAPTTSVVAASALFPFNSTRKRWKKHSCNHSNSAWRRDAAPALGGTWAPRPQGRQRVRGPGRPVCRCAAASVPMTGGNTPVQHKCSQIKPDRHTVAYC